MSGRVGVPVQATGALPEIVGSLEAAGGAAVAQQRLGGLLQRLHQRRGLLGRQGRGIELEEVGRGRQGRLLAQVRREALALRPGLQGAEGAQQVHARRALVLLGQQRQGALGLAQALRGGRAIGGHEVERRRVDGEQLREGGERGFRLAGLQQQLPLQHVGACRLGGTPLGLVEQGGHEVGMALGLRHQGLLAQVVGDAARERAGAGRLQLGDLDGASVISLYGGYHFTRNISAELRAGDISGDFRADLIWYGPGSTKDSLWRGRASSSPYFAKESADLGINGDYQPIALDLNGEGTEDIVLSDPAGGVYKRLVIKGDKLVGAVLYGDTPEPLKSSSMQPMPIATASTISAIMPMTATIITNGMSFISSGAGSGTDDE